MIDSDVPRILALFLILFLDDALAIVVEGPVVVHGGPLLFTDRPLLEIKLIKFLTTCVLLGHG